MVADQRLLQENVESLREKNENLESTLARTEHESRLKVADVQLEKKCIEDAYARTFEQLQIEKEKTKKMLDLESALARNEQEKCAKDDQIQKLGSDLTKAQQHLIHVQREKKKAEDSSTTTIEQLQNEKDHLSNKIRELESTLARVEEKCREKDDEARKLGDDLSTVRQNLAQVQREKKSVDEAHAQIIAELQAEKDKASQTTKPKQQGKHYDPGVSTATYQLTSERRCLLSGCLIHFTL